MQCTQVEKGTQATWEYTGPEIITIEFIQIITLFFNKSVK